MTSLNENSSTYGVHGFAYLKTAKALEENDPNWQRYALVPKKSGAADNQNINLMDYISPGLAGNELLLEIHSRAYESFKKANMPRLCWFVASELAKTFERDQKYRQAHQLCMHLANAYRKEQWWYLLHTVLEQAVGCALADRNDSGAKRALAELLSGPFNLSAQERKSLLCSKAFTAGEPLVYESNTLNGLMDCAPVVSFRQEEAQIINPVPVQLQIGWRPNVQLPISAIAVQLMNETAEKIVVCFCLKQLFTDDTVEQLQIKQVVGGVVAQANTPLTPIPPSKLPAALLPAVKNASAVYTAALPSLNYLNTSSGSHLLFQFQLFFSAPGCFSGSKLTLCVANLQNPAPIVLVDYILSKPTPLDYLCDWWTVSDNQLVKKSKALAVQARRQITVDEQQLPMTIAIKAPERLFFDETGIIPVTFSHANPEGLRLISKTYSISSGIICSRASYASDKIATGELRGSFCDTQCIDWPSAKPMEDQICVFQPSPTGRTSGSSKVSLTVKLEVQWRGKTYHKQASTSLNTGFAFDIKAEVLETSAARTSLERLIRVSLICNTFASVELLKADIALPEPDTLKSSLFFEPDSGVAKGIESFEGNAQLQPKQNFYVYRLAKLNTLLENVDVNPSQFAAAIDLGSIHLQWRRDREAPVSSSCVSLPPYEPQWPNHVSLTVTSPTSTVVYEPFPCKICFYNYTPQFVSGLQVHIESAEGMTFAGYRTFELVLLPQQTTSFELQCLATIPGEAMLPKIKITAHASPIAASNANANANAAATMSEVSSRKNSTASMAPPPVKQSLSEIPFVFSSESSLKTSQQKLTVFVYPLPDMESTLKEQEIKPSSFNSFSFLLDV